MSSWYPNAKHTRHWSPDNTDEVCSFTTFKEERHVESPEHLLLKGAAYSNTRVQLIPLGMKTHNPEAYKLFVKFLFSNTTKLMQFLLDPEEILSAQTQGDDIYRDISYNGRSWCFSLHRERMKRLGKWNFK